MLSTKRVLVLVSLHVKLVISICHLYMGTMYPLSWLHSKAVQISDHEWTLTFLLVYLLTRLQNTHLALLAALAPNHALHAPSITTNEISIYWGERSEPLPCHLNVKFVCLCRVRPSFRLRRGLCGACS